MLRKLANNMRGVAAVEFAISLPLLVLMYMGGYATLDIIAANRRVTVATNMMTEMLSRDLPVSIITNGIPTAWTTTSVPHRMMWGAYTLSPYDMNQATEQITLLRVCNATHAYVVWTQGQSQTLKGSIMTPTTITTQSQLPNPLMIAGGPMPNSSFTPSASNVVPIPTGLATGSMIPTSPNTSNVCNNTAPSNAAATQVGTAGAYIYAGQINFTYVPPINFGFAAQIPMSDTIYISPRQP